MFHGYDYSKFTGGTDLERAKTISGAVNFIMDREKVDDKDSFIKEALMLHQALSLCSSLVDEESRFEAAFFESVRVLVLRLTNTGVIIQMLLCCRRLFIIQKLEKLLLKKPLIH